MRWLARNRIRLNVGPSSNVMLGAVSSLASHPIRVLVDPDPMIFGQSVSQEDLNLYNAGVLSADERDAIRVKPVTHVGGGLAGRP